MAANNYVLCLDIGCTTIKAAEYSYGAAGEMILERFAFSDYGRNLEDDTAEAAVAAEKAAMTEALKKIITENKFKAKFVNLSLSGKNTYIKFVKLPAMVSDEKKLKQIIEFEAKTAIPFDLDEVVWDSQLISSNLESGEIEAMFVVVKTEEIEYVTDLIEKMGKEVQLVEVAPTAIYNAARANGIGSQNCEMLLNIGGRCSLLTFVDQGRFFARPIPIAGSTITHQISKEFGISYADAEEMKRKHGFVALGGAYEEPDSEVSTIISKIVRNVMTRLHGEINRSINVYRSQQGGRKPEKLYLSGGSSVMEFTPKFFEEKLRIPTDYFNPFQKIAIGQEVNKEELAELAPCFPETTGLAVRNATKCPVEVSLVPSFIKRCNDFKERRPYFYASAICFLLILLVTFFCLMQQKQIAEEKCQATQNELKKLEASANKVKNAENGFGSVQGQYDAAANILMERSKWPNTMNTMQKILPEGLWLSEFSFGTQQVEQKKEEPRRSSRRRRGAEPVFDEPVFGGDAPAQVKTEPDKFDAVNFTAHFLRKSDEDLTIKFCDNVEKAKIGSEEIFEFKADTDQTKIKTVTPGMGPYNISTFTLSAKLKNPVTR